ncbi:MAG TPA: hypothetical protein VGH76_18545 [Actinomycetospora sp.]|uniref:hypothetical protein n=1 Tax=Actinomycetospora sp. TaxID=1872135 RepID=UPI002F423F93
MTTVNGLPAHILLVHAVVVLVPLTAVVLLLVALWPAARPRLAVVGGVLAVVTLVSVPLTTDAGEWLERRLPSTPLLQQHTQLGDYLLPWAIGLAVIGVALAAREVLAGRRARAARTEGPGAAVASHAARPRSASAPGGVVLTVVLAVLTVVVAVGSVTTTYEIGDSGARAAWTGKFSPTPLPRPPHPAGDEG